MKHHAVQKLAAALAVCVFGSAYAQEALKSAEEEYYDFLSLNGDASRPALNYRTLSDSVWRLTDDAEDTHVWRANNLGTTYTLWAAPEQGGNWFLRGIDEHITMKIYGPEWFNSFNTAAPYGQNDGALWQGRGYNTSLTAGIRFEGYGFEATIKPQLSYSQNMGFTLMDPAAAYSNADYAGKAGIYGNYSQQVIDLPQRFGNKPFFTFDWGDTEIRWSLYSFTIGFGTQSMWLGPAYLNPILHSNNAATYPKLDIGLRRQSIVIPKVNWYLGDIEFRIWTGYLSESDYFDTDSSNDHNMIHGLSFAYAPSFIPGLTLGVNRTCVVKWDWENLIYIFPMNVNSAIGQQDAGEDQKISFTADWVFPQVGLEIYGEMALDDFLQGGFVQGFIRYPFDTLAYLIGLKKTFTLSETHSIYAQFIFEHTNMEIPRNRKGEGYTFDSHYQILQGHTNRGQNLNNPLYGGNGQFFAFKFFYPQGASTLFVYRNNPNNNYMYQKVGNGNGFYKSNFTIGIDTTYFIHKDIRIFGSFSYNMITNPFYDTKDVDYWHNFVIQLGGKFVL